MNPTESAGDFATIALMNDRLQRYITRLETEVAEYESGTVIRKLRERIAGLEKQLKSADATHDAYLAENLRLRERIAELENHEYGGTPVRTADYIVDDGPARTYLIVDISK